jgi:hypothetical protein
MGANCTTGTSWKIVNASNRNLVCREYGRTGERYWYEGFGFPATIPANSQTEVFRSELYRSFIDRQPTGSWRYSFEGSSDIVFTFTTGSFVVCPQRFYTPGEGWEVHPERHHPIVRYNSGGGLREQDSRQMDYPHEVLTTIVLEPRELRREHQLVFIGDSNLRRLAQDNNQTNGGRAQLRTELRNRRGNGWRPDVTFWGRNGPGSFDLVNIDSLDAALRLLSADQAQQRERAQQNNIELRHYNFICVGWSEFDDLYRRNRCDDAGITALSRRIRDIVRDAGLLRVRVIYNGSEAYAQWKDSQDTSRNPCYSERSGRFASEIRSRGGRVFNNAEMRRFVPRDTDIDTSQHLGPAAEPVFARWIMGLADEMSR